MSAAPQLTTALDGRTIVLAVERRAEELASALGRHGATIEHAPALSTLRLHEDGLLIERTGDLIAEPPEIVAALTGVGFRGWMEAADAAGLGTDLRAALAGARIVARGAKAHGAVRQAGLLTAWVADTETTAEVGDHLLAGGARGRRIAIQHHGTGADGLDELLRRRGAQVVAVAPYRSIPPRDPAALQRSVRRAAVGEVDAVVLTAAPAASAWLEESERLSVLAAIRDRALSGQLVMACIGAVTAGPVEARGLPVLMPDRGRLGSLVRALVHHYEVRS
ncbi:MAG: uroporphyrinogen-III synthase [Brachybacterium tyrofermentans]|uniref:Uroporphyrinogen-III synthase n=1 Tax=Brachybacterium tyrofermentans TaxID=47848 RepID=A0ABW0FK09_9MICO|nr:uroporphyrinogen-III synthase [Brachybacterium tyrofermentans]SLN01281.1 putative transcriptional regulator [Corynebacterium xerosis]